MVNTGSIQQEWNNTTNCVDSDLLEKALAPLLSRHLAVAHQWCVIGKTNSSGAPAPLVKQIAVAHQVRHC
jgi:hypothetical protein